MSETKTKTEELEDIAYQLTKAGESASTAIGDDLQSVIESAQYDDITEQSLFDLVEGELENLRDTAGFILKQVHDLRKK